MDMTENGASGVLLKNGRVVDGTGGASYTGNLLIKDGCIEAVGPGEIEFSGEVIDCSGKVIAPGFIDMHTHMDWVLPIKDHPELKTPFTAQGITTFVTGNCGFGIAGFKRNSPYRNKLTAKADGLYPMEWDSMEEYFAFLGSQGMSHNASTLAGLGTARTSIRGFKSGPLSEAEMTELLGLMEEAMDQGACGVSLGLGYEPCIFATLPELKRVAELVKRKDKILTVHMKAYSALSGVYPLKPFGTPHNLISLEETIELARATGVRLQLSHLIFVGRRTWKTYDKAIEIIDSAIAEGLDIKFDTYAYHCGNSIINVFMPEWFLAQGPAAFENRGALLRLRAEITLMEKLLGWGYKDIQLTNAYLPHLTKFNGMFMTEIAKQRGLGNFENMVDIAKQTKGSARVLNHGYSNVAQVQSMMQHPACLFQTDTEVEMAGTQNPAAYGNFPRLLKYARDMKLLSLEEVVHKMTGAAAERFFMKDRGILQKGYAADITVFDWQTVTDNNTDKITDAAPTGIDHVFINGHQALRDGVADGTVLGGQVVPG